jgi:uncharacterized membrane protein
MPTKKSTKKSVTSVQEAKKKTFIERWKSLTLKQTFPIILIVMSLVGLGASMALTIEELAVYKNPNHQLSCSINPIIACGPVMKSKEAAVVGDVPNPYFGLIAFAIILCVGASMLAGAEMKRWYWLTFQAGAVGGWGFVIWLMIHSIYVIGALCLYCMATWVAVSTLCWYLFQWNLQEGHILVPANVKRFLREHHGDVIAGWLLFIVFLILNHFWYYFGPLLHLK